MVFKIEINWHLTAKPTKKNKVLVCHMNLRVKDWCNPGDKCPPLPGCNQLVSKPTTRQATEVKLISSLPFRK
jgi:hypothetical protein